MLPLNSRHRLVRLGVFPTSVLCCLRLATPSLATTKGPVLGMGGCLETQTSPTTPTLLMTAETTGSPVPPHPSEQAKGESSTV